MENIAYKINSIILNGRSVEINNILLGNVTTHSDFETNTINFIREWLNHIENFLIDTSGSTGTPKKINITRQQIEQSARSTISALNLNEYDTALVCLNTNYIAGKMMLARALIGNMKIIALEPTSNPLLQLTERFDFCAFVPLQVETILNYEEHIQQVNKAKAIIVGGAAINQSLQELIKSKIKIPIYATYGMTETISHIALQRLNGRHNQKYFKILPGIKIDLDDRECLTIEATYLNEKLITNDLVKIINANEFIWLGRWDNIINTGGIKVVPEEIECEIQKILVNQKINQNFFIAGIPDSSLGFKVVLVVEGNVDPKWEYILMKLKQSFARYVIPKKILNIEKFILTKTNKIDRKGIMKLIMAQYLSI